MATRVFLETFMGDMLDRALKGLDLPRDSHKLIVAIDKDQDDLFILKCSCTRYEHHTLPGVAVNPVEIAEQIYAHLETEKEKLK